MRSYKRVYLSLFAALSPLVCIAQTPAPPAAPANPMVAPIKALRLANNFKCLITVQPKAKSPAPSTASPRTAAADPAGEAPPAATAEQTAKFLVIKGYMIAKEGKVLHLVKSTSEGITEYWAMPGRQLVKRKKDPAFIPMLPGDPEGVDLNETDFPGLHWALGMTPNVVTDPAGRKFLVVEIDAKKTPATKQIEHDIEQYRDRLGKHARQADIEKMLGHATAAGTLRLVLDSETRLPLRSEDATSVSTYAFSPAPAVIASMSPEVAAEYKKWMAVMNRNKSNIDVAAGR